VGTPSETDLLRAEVEKCRLVIAQQAEVVSKQAAIIAELTAKVATLEALVFKQAELLGRNSKNSNSPPSSDAPAGGSNKPRKRKKKGRQRGGQKGHEGSHRKLVAPEHVDEVVDMFPARCDRCHRSLPKTLDPNPKRHQHTELSPFVPHVTEYRRHAVRCALCGHRTRAHYDDDVIPRYAFGPRLMGVVVMLTGVYHLSRRNTARLLFEMLGLGISTGSISNIEHRMSAALEPAVDEVWEHARAAPVKHTDGTTWLQAGMMLALWTLATAGVTVFKILKNGQRATLEREILPTTQGVLVSDRATALQFWAMHLRQICWAHLLRKFISFAERDGPARRLGRELLDCTGVIFSYWNDFKEGRLTREQLAARVAPVRADFEHTLRRAIDADISGLSGSCANIWEHREALWSFVEVDGVEPTNNHAERELRAFVLWRKRSFGTQSDRGNRFAERMMTIAHTARKQGRDLLAFLVACASHADDESTPSLFAVA
jgi:transposase